MISRRVPALLLMALVMGCAGADTGGTCGAGALTALQLGRSHGRIEAGFTVERAHPDAEWRLVVVHEGHVAWRGTARADRQGKLYLHRRLGDYGGVDHVMVRATSPDGASCGASATVVDEN